MYFVVIYLSCLAYAALAAISPQATIVPNTWAELARVGVILILAFLCVWIGQMFRIGTRNRLYTVTIPQEGDYDKSHTR